MRKRLMMILTMVALALTMMIPTAQATTNRTDDKTKSASADRLKQKNTYVEYTGAEAQEMARKCGVTIPPNGTLVKFVVDESVVTSEPGASAMWGSGYYLKNVTWSKACGAPVIAAASGPGPGTLKLEQTVGVEATFSASVEIGPEEVKVGVGFDVTETYEVVTGYEVEVPAGELWEIQAHARYDVAHYEVWYDPFVGFDYLAGYGEALKPIGACYAVIKYQ